MQYENTFLKPITNNGNGRHHPDDLDVVSLMQKTISFIYRFKIILSAFIIAGLGCGLSQYFASPRQYSTRLIVHSMFLSNQEEIEIIGNWKKLLRTSEKVQLAGMMNCRVQVVEKLASISAEEILKTYAVNNPNGFIIIVSVTDNLVLNELQRGIVYGLNNSPYVKEKIEAKKTKNKGLIKKATEEIAKLNATKTLIDSLVRAKQASTTPVLLDISRISAEMMDLNEKLFYYSEDLKFLTGVQVLENFTKGKTMRQGLLKFSFLGAASGLFIGYLFSLFLFIRMKIRISNTVPSL